MNEKDILEGRLDDNMINDLRTYIGADSNEQTEAAANASIATLTTTLAKNAESPTGRQSLLSALDRDHDGSILDDAVDMIFGRKQPRNSKTVDGPGILEHIFGRKQERIAEGIEQRTGLDKGKALKLLITLAPLILGALGKAKRQQPGGGNNILDILRNTVLSRNSQFNDQGF